MNRTLNTVIFTLVSTIVLILIILALFFIVFILLYLILKDKFQSILPVVSALLPLVCIVGGFFIYSNLMKWFMAKVDLEKYIHVKLINKKPE